MWYSVEKVANEQQNILQYTQNILQYLSTTATGTDLSYSCIYRTHPSTLRLGLLSLAFYRVWHNVRI